MASCHLCRNETTAVLELGMQPVCNRFLKSSSDKESTYRLALGSCKSCGLLQLVNPFPVNEIRPIHDWIMYTEPEEHLDVLSETLSRLLGANKTARICGISSKDASLIERMQKLGFNSAITLDLRKDFGEDNAVAGVETVQNLLTVKQARAIAENTGKFDLVIARHILEHAYSIAEFMNGLHELVNPDGCILFEVPDCTQHLKQLDYSTIWEEHISYFTPFTFKKCINLNRFVIERFDIFPYTLEDCMAAIVRPSVQNIDNVQDKNVLVEEMGRVLSFSNGFGKRKELLQSFFSDYAENHGKIAFIGAGHFAGVFINIFELRNHIECIIDDNANKQGLIMPGSNLPILDSSALLKSNIKLGIFSLNPDVEDKIISKNVEFVRKGGHFLSLCFNSKYSLYSYIGRHKKTHVAFKEESKEVYYAADDIVTLQKQDIKMFKEKANSNPRQKARLCTHHDTDDKLHEMFIVHKKGAYIRPHKHLSKSESLHVIEGTAYLVVFDDKGEITEIIEMGDFSSGNNFYYRMSGPYYHTLLIKSDYFVFHETTNGPFNRSDTVFAPWAAAEDNSIAVGEFMNNLEVYIKRFLSEDKKIS